MIEGTTERNIGWQRPATVARRLMHATAATACAAIALLPMLAGAQSRAVLERIIRRQVLANGMEIIAVENHGVPLVTVEVDVRNGSFTQTAETAGLAHLYEHMFFKGNARYPEAESFMGRASELGAKFNARTQEEQVNYFLTVHRDSLAGGMRFLASALRAPLFHTEELNRERVVVLGEYDRNESNPFFALMQSMGQRLWGTEWPRKNTIGDRTVIGTATPEQMRAIQRRYYVPNNSALIVAGDIVPDSVFALAQRIFGDWPRQADPFQASPIPPMPRWTANGAIISEAPVSAITVLLQWHGPSVGRDPAATYAADVLSDALNQPSSRLQRNLVDSGLWQGVGVNYFTLNHTGPITISGQTTPGKFREAMRALDAEIAQFAQPGYITANALQHVKAERTVSSAFGLERSSELAHTIGFWWCVSSLDYFLGYVDNMASRSLPDLAAYAATYIVAKPRLVGVLLSPADRAALKLTEQELVAMIGTAK